MTYFGFIAYLSICGCRVDGECNPPFQYGEFVYPRVTESENAEPICATGCWL